MPGRVVIQWDKDDCADLGIIKVDLLGLGMLAALEEMVPTIKQREGTHVDLAHLPPDDPQVFRMLQVADTVCNDVRANLFAGLPLDYRCYSASVAP